MVPSPSYIYIYTCLPSSRIYPLQMKAQIELDKERSYEAGSAVRGPAPNRVIHWSWTAVTPTG